jgi:Carboxypeptidase regulatory-like domain/PDZ domain
MKLRWVAAAALIVAALLLVLRFSKSTVHNRPSTASDLGAGASGLAGERARPGPPLRLPVATTREDAKVAAGELGGRVMSSVDGKPIARAALVFLHEGAAVSTETDAQGRFVVTAASPGAYELTSATATGFAPFEPQLGHSPVTLWARAGVRVDDVTIYLTPAVELTVVVQDDKGKPLAGAEVRAFAEARGAADAKVTTTDAKGEATVAAQPFDVVEARHAGFKRASARVSRQTEATRRLTLRLLPGADAPRATIAGRVVDGRGQPVDGALVEAWAYGSDGNKTPAWAQTLSRADGGFTLTELDDATYNLRASARGEGAVARAGVRAGSRDVELRLGAAEAGIRGVVRDGSGKPVTAFTVLAFPRLGPLARGPEERATVIDAQGRYALLLPAGSYVVSAAARGFARSDERTVEVRDTPVDVDFTLRGGSRVFGRVVERGSAKPLQGARVELEGDAHGDGVTLAYDTRSGADGAFTLDGLSQGRHSILVEADGHDGRIVSGLQVPADGALGPLAIDLAPVKPGEEPKTELVGIGAVIGADESGAHLVIKNAMPGGGAAEAGLGAGDIILAIDGDAVEQGTFAEAIQKIRGPESSVVVLTVQRKDGSTQVIPVRRLRITT